MVRVFFINLVLSLGLLFGLSACMDYEERFGDRVFDSLELSVFDLKIAVALGYVNNDIRLRFKISFVMPRDRILLKLPDVFLRAERLYTRIENFSVSDKGKLIPHAKDPSIMVLEHPAGEQVELTYFYRPDDPLKPGKIIFSAPIIRDNYFQFVGLMALIYPVGLIDAPSFPVSISWEVPDDFQIFNSFGSLKNPQNIVTDFDKLRDAFFVGGNNIRKYEVKVRDRPVNITFSGVWQQISDQQFIDIVTRLISKQRETWNDDNFPYFLVHFLAAESDCTGNINFAGTAHPNSFRAFFPSGCQIIPDMKQLISHELTHGWIGKKIRVGKERGHIDGKWLTEGFADYYGRLIAYRAGVITEDEYFNSLNRQLEKYYLSSEKDVSLAELVKRMYKQYSNRSLEDVPYQQGEIVALRLNKSIVETSRSRYSLDDVIREMLKIADREGGSKNFSIEEIASLVDKYSQNAFHPEYQKIKTGEVLSPPDMLGCRPLEQKNFTERYFIRRPSSSLIQVYGRPSHQCMRK